uniref:Uncharacterized protein n=1 Tax=Anabas testudineus TaxID=64144 RepID=A0A3Q1HH18_ANATE
MFSVVLSAQGGDHHSQKLLPVVRIHMELLGVHHAQLGISVLDVVQVLHSTFQTTHDGLSVFAHLGVSSDGGVGGQVAKGGDGGTLSICPLDHVDGVKSPIFVTKL